MQLNLHADYFGQPAIDVSAPAACAFADAVGSARVILQHRGGPLPVEHAKLEYLFDRSEGAGRSAFDEWPAPPNGDRYGYAGGIGPDNVCQAIATANARGGAYWLDMEARVRTTRGEFDLDAVESVAGQAFGPPWA